MLRSISSSGCLLAGLLSLVCGTGCGDNETTPPARVPYTGVEPEPLSCVPNLDGKIDASEVAPAIGTPISYLLSPPGVERNVSLAGATGPEGLVWDFSTDFADDQEARVAPQSIAGKWYEASFPPDAFVTPFDGGGRVENVGRHTDGALLLLGLASREENPSEGKTLVVYDPPVEVLRFPSPAWNEIRVGGSGDQRDDSWTALRGQGHLRRRGRRHGQHGSACVDLQNKPIECEPTSPCSPPSATPPRRSKSRSSSSALPKSCGSRANKVKPPRTSVSPPRFGELDSRKSGAKS